MLMSPFTKNAPKIQEARSDSDRPPRVPTARTIATGPEMEKRNATRALAAYTAPKSATAARNVERAVPGGRPGCSIMCGESIRIAPSPCRLNRSMRSLEAESQGETCREDHVSRSAMVVRSVLRRPGKRRGAGPGRETLRAHRGPGGEGRRLGADAARARREDARHGESDVAGFRHGSWLGRRPQHHRCRQARCPGAGCGVQRGHGQALAGYRGERRRVRQGAVRPGRYVCGRYFPGDGAGDLSADGKSQQADAE